MALSMFFTTKPLVPLRREASLLAVVNIEGTLQLTNEMLANRGAEYVHGSWVLRMHTA